MEVQMLTDQLTVIFRKVFNDESIILNDEITANDIGSWDSLSHMIMIAEVENAFSIKFSLREINKLKNVGTLVKLIESKMA
ncbi:MAG TPA: acyl carrier protein [Chitinophagaceae bacterium]|jgi:acyl carrier protein